MYDYRASELGGCIKMQAAKRQGRKPRETPAKAQVMFDRGNAHETACLAVMREEGWTVASEQEEVTIAAGWPDYQLTGHIDCMVMYPGSTVGRIGEIKSPQSWNIFRNTMYHDEPSALIQRYKWQISCYMVALDLEAVFITLEEYRLKYHVIEVPFYGAEDIRLRLADIEEVANSGRLPMVCSVREYPCPFVHLHEDENVEFTEDSLVDALATRYNQWKNAEQDAKRKKDGAKLELLEAMGDRRSITTPNSKVTFYDRTDNRVDMDAMRADGVDVDAYRRPHVTENIPRVDIHKTDADDPFSEV